MECLVPPAISGIEKSLYPMTWVNFTQLPPHSPWRCQPPLDLPWDLGKCLGELDDASYHRDRKVSGGGVIIWVKSHPAPPQPSLDLPWDLGKCLGEFDDASYHRDRKVSVCHHLGEISPSPLRNPRWPRQPSLDLSLDLGKVHGKFGDASYHRDRKVSVGHHLGEISPSPLPTPR